MSTRSAADAANGVDLRLAPSLHKTRVKQADLGAIGEYVKEHHRERGSDDPALRVGLRADRRSPAVTPRPSRSKLMLASPSCLGSPGAEPVRLRPSSPSAQAPRVPLEAIETALDSRASRTPASRALSTSRRSAAKLRPTSSRSFRLSN